MSINALPNFDWQSILQLSFLPLYQVDAHSDNEWLSVGYDFVFEFPQATLVLLVKEETLESPSLDVEISLLNQSKQKSVSQLVARHQQLYKQHALAHKKAEEQPDFIAASDEPQIYFVGITLLTVMHEQNPYPIPHQYGGRYFQEECVVDLDEDVHAIQVFSLHSLLNLVELLKTPDEFLDYLSFHRQNMSQQQLFASEVELANSFIHSADFFDRQLQLQQQLIKRGMMDSIDPHLQKLMDKDVSKEDLQPLLEQMESYSSIWRELVQGWVNKCKQQQTEVPVDILRLLLFPSTYMRMQFLETLLMYGDSSEQQKQQGYICQQRHYSDFGCHYMMVVYGLNADSQFSKDAIADQADQLLLDMDIKLANTMTTDLILLAFDMSQQLASGGYEVAMDVYHRSVSS